MLLKLWCWRRLLRVPWTARRPNQSVLKEINPEHSLEGLMLKLKLQCFGHLMQSRIFRKDLDAEKDWRQEETTEDEMVGWHHQLDMTLGKLPELVRVREAWPPTIHGVTNSRTWLSDWTELELNWLIYFQILGFYCVLIMPMEFIDDIVWYRLYQWKYCFCKQWSSLHISDIVLYWFHVSIKFSLLFSFCILMNRSSNLLPSSSQLNQWFSSINFYCPDKDAT